MGLYERLLGLEEPGLSVHGFHALLGEIERGKLTAAQAATALGLTAAEQTEAQTLIGRIVSPLETISLGGFAQLANVGAAYDAIGASQGLGWARLQTAGITGVEFEVRVNKVGTGTQSWQLWNDTDGSEITVIDDAGPTGAKTLSITRTFTPPLGAGIKAVRVRAKSTTATDDPVYFGGSLLIRRVERLTSTELHEVLLLGRAGAAPYDTVASVKGRLGV
jgi:hypothetical protein